MVRRRWRRLSVAGSITMKGTFANLSVFFVCVRVCIFEKEMRAGKRKSFSLYYCVCVFFFTFPYMTDVVK